MSLSLARFADPDGRTGAPRRVRSPGSRARWCATHLVGSALVLIVGGCASYQPRPLCAGALCSSLRRALVERPGAEALRRDGTRAAVRRLATGTLGLLDADARRLLRAPRPRRRREHAGPRLRRASSPHGSDRIRRSVSSQRTTPRRVRPGSSGWRSTSRSRSPASAAIGSPRRSSFPRPRGCPSPPRHGRSAAACATSCWPGAQRASHLRFSSSRRQARPRWFACSRASSSSAACPVSC